MTKELIEYLKKERNISGDLLKFFSGDDMPDTFVIQDAMDKHHEERTSFEKLKWTKELKVGDKIEPTKEQLEAHYITIASPVTKKLATAMGKKKEDLKDLSLTKQIDALLAFQLEEQGKNDSELVETMRTTLNESKGKVIELEEKVSGFEETFETRVAAATKESTDSVQKFKVGKLWKDLIYDEKFKFDKGAKFYDEYAYQKALGAGYMFVVEGEEGNEVLAVKSADGTKAMSIDKKREYTDPSQLINDLGLENKWFVVSKKAGDESERKIGSAASVIGEKTIDRTNSEALKKRLNMA